MNDRQRILQMYKDGKISLDEADSLLGALDENQAQPVSFKDARGRKPKSLKVTVDANSQSKNDFARVNINLPLSLVKACGPIIKSSLRADFMKEKNLQGIDIAAIIDNIDELIENTPAGEDIVHIDAAENGEDQAKVRVYFE